MSFFFFFFNDTATTEIYTLSLHDALPIFVPEKVVRVDFPNYDSLRKDLRDLLTASDVEGNEGQHGADLYKAIDNETGRASESDRKSTRLNSSHLVISYAVFCLKKKTQNKS